MTSAFSPDELCSEASLNRTVVGGLPAFDLLSAAATAGLMGPAGADEAGHRVAALLATLRRGDSTSGLGMTPTPWRLAYLEHWRTISHVWIGGGTAARLGASLAKAARRELEALGVNDLSVCVPDHPAALALVGAARTVTAATTAAVFDFGHSLVKIGVARYDDKGALERIVLRAPVPTAALGMPPVALINSVRSAVDRTLARSGPVDAVVASVAAYVRAGEPSDPNGAYGALRSKHLDVPVLWVHDGTAAGRAVASRARTAVLMLGTAIGVGFGADPRTVRPLKETFQVE